MATGVQFMASPATLAAYHDEARRKIRRAHKLYPDVPLVDALFEYVERYPTKLKPGTVGLWKQQLRIAVAEVAKLDSRGFYPRQISDLQDRMDAAVAALRGSPDALRTATKKRKEVPRAEVVKVFAHLKARALALHRVRMAATAIYCILMPRIGNRPFELVGARVENGVITIRNAKRAAGQEIERCITVATWDLHHRVALAALIDIVNTEVKEGGYAAWLSMLAEILARACSAANVDRIAPTTFRHTALSTWSEAGYSTEQIALLAGHFCRRSPAHYIRTASAWGLEDAVVTSTAPKPSLVLQDSDESVDRSEAGALDIEPMPQPTPPQGRPDNSEGLWRDHRRRMDKHEQLLDQRVKRALAERGLSATGDQVAPLREVNEPTESATPGRKGC